MALVNGIMHFLAPFDSVPPVEFKSSLLCPALDRARQICLSQRSFLKSGSRREKVRNFFVLIVLAQQLLDPVEVGL